MAGNTLTQYISKNRQAILKLKGLDEFQKLRGFLCGLDADYRLHVNTQDPELFEDIIKHTQTFDDDHGKKGQDSYAKSKWQSWSPNRAKFSKKRHSSSSPQEAKKPKPSRDELSRATHFGRF